MNNRIRKLFVFFITAVCFASLNQANAQGITQELARANFLKSLPNFQTASKLMFGRDKTESQLSQYFNELFAIKYGMKKVIALPEANTYLKEYIARPNNADLRREIIENFMWDARGRKPDKAEYEAYDVVLKLKKTNYAQELLNQSKYLKETKSEKNQMVNRAYQSALCRDASQNDLNSSTSSLYVNEVDGLRKLLWSPSYTALRNETIKRWWQRKFKQNPTMANLQVAIERFEPVKAICSEMDKRWNLSEIN